MPNVITVDPVDELFESWIETKEKTPMVFKDDPVVLACVAWRMKTYMDFDSLQPTEEDRVLGAQVM